MTGDSFFVLTDAPSSLDFGVDCMSYETGPKFSGLSLIPPGLHFIHHSTGMGARTGFFRLFKKSEVVARQWDASTEEIVPVNTLSEESQQALQQAIQLGELNEHLGPYPLSQYSTWRNLSNYVSLSCLERAGCSYETNIGPGEDPEDTLPSCSASLHCKYAPLSLKYSSVAEMEKSLLQSTHASSNPSDVTSLYMDKSAVVQSLVQSYFNNNWNDLLGELQLSFLLFVLLYSHPALRQWKSLIATMCKCDRLFHLQPEFMCAFIRILYEQLSFCPIDFFEAELSKKNFLQSSMSDLFEILNSKALDASLLEHRKRLLLFVQKKFGLFEERAQSFVNSEGNLVHSEPFNLVEEDLPVFLEDLKDSVTNRMATAGSRDMPPNERCSFEERLAIMSAALDAVSQQRGASIAQFDSEDIVRIDFIDSSSSPISVAVTEGAAPAAPETVVSSSIPLSNLEIEVGLYSWRYPHLFDAMVSEKEDLTMTAMRILDEDCTNSLTDRNRFRLLAEAKMFLEEEVSKRSRL